MKVTLRKANALQAAITEAVDKLKFGATIEINEFQYPENEISTAYDEWVANSDRREALLDALYEIRKEVAKANAGTSGISDILADIARVEKDIRFYTGVERVGPRVQGDVLRGKLGKLKEQPENARTSIYGRDDSVMTTIFGKSELEAFAQAVKDAKKEKQRLQDALLEANIRNEIELSEYAEATLKEEDLI